MEAEDWLVMCVAGDRIGKGDWGSLQTWRKTLQMRFSQNVPLALDTLMLRRHLRPQAPRAPHASPSGCTRSRQ